MFVPEYTVTSKTLKNIANIEYGKAVIENTVILQNWEKQLQNQTLVENVFSAMQLEGMAISEDQVKKIVDGLETNQSSTASNIKNAFLKISEFGKHKDLDEQNLKTIHALLTGKETYRSAPLTNKSPAEEILADIVELYDWLNSIDARDSHPVIVAAIAKARLEEIAPFENFNTTVADIITLTAMRALNYSVRDFISINSYYFKGSREYFSETKQLTPTNSDFTKWIEYFTQALSMQISSVQEKVKLLAKDTKVAKATGRIRLTPRQEKIVEYLQDYGILQNKDFAKLFPEKSEDSILRDLKALLDQGIVIKAGSTKSSRYELK